MNTQIKINRAKTLGFVIAAFSIALLSIGLGGCSSSETSRSSAASQTTNSAPASNTAANKTASSPRIIPGSLVNASEYGENVYDLAKAKNWTKAGEKLSALKEANKQLGTDGASGANASELDSVVATLEKDVAAKDQAATMRDANHATLVTANLMANYQPKTPVEVTKLDYYGRELEVWGAAKDTARLQTTASEMSRTWNTLRPTLESHGGAAEAKTFGNLMTRVEAAKTPAEYAKLATSVLDEVDNLEKVFSK